MKRYLPKNAEDASALVITLLVVLLLTTIAVSFLSTARLEQTATRNYSAKTMAEQFAISATEQAVAKIEQGFNATGNGTGNFTSILTTQPGAIKKYFFSNGTLQTNSTITTELFTSGSGNLTNLNNFQNPGNSTSNATSNQWTITGNASERINVFMENVTATVNGTNQTVGRIAYYVDDEGAKLNLNAATDNRSTLNVGARPQDIAALIGGNQSANFNNTINGKGSNATSEQDKQKDIKHWSHFFRPEQVSAAVAGFSGNNTPFLSTATTSASSTANITHLLTPWGTQRVAINTLSTNATDGTGDASVRSIFESLTGLNGTSVNGTYTASNSTYGLTGQGLQNIFGGNFSTKYTPAGVKQIAANMLQMRDPNTFSVNASFGYNGSILCDALGPDPDPYDASQYYYGIPGNYLANTPFPVINEIGFSAKYSYPRTLDLRVFLGFYIELFNPYDISYTNTTNATLVFRLDKIQFKTNTTGNNIIGVENDYRQYQLTYPAMPSRWGWYEANIDNTRKNRDAFDRGATAQAGDDAIFFIPSIPARSTKIVFLDLVTQWRGAPRSSTAITGNVTIRIERILLLANRDNPRSIRDAISGNDTGDFVDATPHLGPSTAPAQPWKLPEMTFKRLDARNKTTRNGTATGAFITGGNVSITATDTVTSSSYHDHIAPSPDSTSGYVIPGDPVLGNRTTYLLSSNSAADKLPPVLDFPAFSSPADLGKVPTNTLYRSLRMQMQPAIEGTLIPDWAMLDVISFGNSTDPNHAFNRFQPVNINGKFYLPGNVTNSSPPTPRTIGLKALAKVVEISANGTLQNPIDLTQSVTLNATNVTRFKGNTANASVIATAIGNMTWSANSTWDTRRTTLRFPADQYILPSEIMEIAGVADAVSQNDYNNSSSHFKRNEGRASALIPAVTTRSNFFTIYAYAQALDKAGNVDSEALTKTLVEVESDTSTTPTTYKVKKLYTQPILLGD